MRVSRLGENFSGAELSKKC